MKPHSLCLTLALGAVCLPLSPLPAAEAPAIRSGEVWNDAEGRPVNAHGGGMLVHEGTYYWYGEIKQGKTYLPEVNKSWGGTRVDVTGVSCYSSKDLLNWKNLGNALPAVNDPASDLHPGKVLERPKVIYNARTRKYVRVFPGRSMEAPAVFKRAGEYYLIASGCTAWVPNAARSAVADSIWGPWKELGNPCQGEKADITFQSQGTCVVEVAGKPGRFVFMADRWNKADLPDSRYVWLPLSFEKEKPVLRWMDRWSPK